MLKKNILKTIVLAAAMTTAFGVTAFAAENTEKTATPAKDPGQYDVVDRDFLGDGVGYALGGASVKDHYYKNPKLTPVKYQPFGICWSYSLMACAEAELIQNNGFPLTTDLSEFQLAYYAKNAYRDKLGFMDESEEYKTYGYLEIPSTAVGSAQAALYTIAAWMAGNDETAYPMPTYEYDLSRDTAYDVKYCVNNAYCLNFNDQKSIKEAVLKYGAVSIAFCSSDYYYDYTYSSWYCPDSVGTDHLVTIVGWDDNYSANNFWTPAPGNGAWIVKNSWGESWGEGGYNYISYYDKSSSGLMAVDFEKKAYDNNYQYDFGVADYYWLDDNNEKMNVYNGIQKVANVFPVKANKSGYETLDAVSFFTQTGNADYTIKIYTNLKDANKPESGTLADTITGKVSAAGYYTVPTKSVIMLEEGSKFSVVVSLKNKNGNYSGVEAEFYYPDYGITPVTAKGQTFMYRYDQWEDVQGKSVNGITCSNARIKAFTTNHKNAELLSAPKVKAGSVKKNEAKLTWSKVSGASKYQVYNPSTKKKETVEGTSFKITGLKSTTKYTYYVRAFAGKKISKWTKFTFMTAPNKVTKLKAAKKTATSVKLTWAKTSKATGYAIYKYDASKKKWTQAGTTTKNNYTVKKLKKGKTYRFKVKAYKTYNKSKVYGAYSSELKAKTKK